MNGIYWAKIKGHSQWPCMVSAEVTKFSDHSQKRGLMRYFIKFYGDFYWVAYVTKNQLTEFDEENVEKLIDIKKIKNRALNKAINQACFFCAATSKTKELHFEKLERRYKNGELPYQKVASGNNNQILLKKFSIKECVVRVYKDKDLYPKFSKSHSKPLTNNKSKKNENNAIMLEQNGLVGNQNRDLFDFKNEACEGIQINSQDYMSISDMQATIQTEYENNHSIPLFGSTELQNMCEKL